MGERRWRAALPSDLKTIARWVDSPTSLTRWAGPDLTWPTDGPTLWQELEGGATPTFCVAEGPLPAAFGQLIQKGPRHWHLARIIVDPARRREGLGEQLCRALLQEAHARHAEHVTLNVFADNAAAIPLYRRLGFVAHGEVDTRGIVPMHLRQFAAHDGDNQAPGEPA
ncbi:GNAT family N-acetyltransferase [Salinicola avicenniae]|uniref:GNAT family N-acetyltransferase n=1 Tax=Salinicola avicenniae TaxID=2916836 RepID=UPI0020745C9F|nr:MULTISPECIES: GNAT family N-acetyltransferase [unclassified Salinicola]